jgi:TonB family protein
MSWLKLLALLPIVGITLALNAETVNDYVYENSQQQPQKKVVKKGNANAQVKVGSKTVEVKKAEPAKTTEKKTVEKKTAEKKAVEKKAPEKKPVETQPVVAKETSDPSRVFDVVEEMPKFPGGDEGMMQFLNSEVKYPKEALEKGTQGRVVVTFIVNTDGSVSDPKVVKSVNPALDAEAIRVVNAMPKWTPGKQNGHVVRVKFTIPVTFRLK